MDELKELRDRLDRIDEELVALFEARMAVTRQVGEYKLRRHLPVSDRVREEEVIAKGTALLRDPALSEDLSELLRTLMAISRRQQEKMQ